ncbi:MAG: DUF6208 family protein, partial [Elainellaceae cyanobacterium]
YSIYLGVKQNLATQWRSLSAETLKSPLSLPVLMTKGPRWNTHAVIGTVGPFRVEQELALNVGAIAQSAGSWTAAIYSYPTYRTVDNLGSLEQARAKDSADHVSESPELSTEKGWYSLALPPGRYSIGLRYYQCADQMVFPTVRIDGQDAVPAQPVSPKVNDFYHTLADQTSGFYRFLHGYIFTLLRWRRWLPASFVRREFLPVGAPETEFFYDAMYAGDRLSLQLASRLVQDFDVYLTVYNRASFPLFWAKVEAETYLSEPISADGFYLFRIRPKAPDAAKFSQDWLDIRLISEPLTP